MADVPHLPGYPEDEFSDFSHRKPAMNHLPNPTPKGIGYDPFISSSKAAGLLRKCALKPGTANANGTKSGARAPGKVGSKTVSRPITTKK